ncbi:MAG: endonuclease/exonuclease/phosphatase family protein [Bacteroidales bacterium]|nr:endonuclease/exonuclease/phosphatase family protein [Bacteroidales bacterium]MDD2425948.1 endonuclease/exonuclease/phosphatase family protein [Bacteroidales bacterium]MDD3989181.1 endonuclease/exonuclease/phosphatase family protein [Bacteroidales bacterium]MDD4639548.1 endonuclease/exonuclease/phosphatase family protein [Bacteroidales bacterium]
MIGKKERTNFSTAIPVAVITVLAGMMLFASKYVNPSRFSPVSLVPPLSPFILVFSLGATIYLLYKRSWWALLTAAAILLNTGSIIPYFKVFYKREVFNSEGKSGLIIASYNIHEFNLMDHTSSLADIADNLLRKGADLISFQEYEPSPLLNEAESEAAFGAFPYKHIVKKSVFCNGMAIFSRHPIKNSGRITFPGSSNGAIWADINYSGITVRLVNLHLQTTGYNSNKEKGVISLLKSMVNNNRIRAEQAGIVRSFADTVAYPLIISGDFNSTQESYAMRTIKRDMKDAFLEGGLGFPGTLRGLFGFHRIDFILYTGDFKCIRSQHERFRWSDHYPVIAELEYQNRR